MQSYIIIFTMIYGTFTNYIFTTIRLLRAPITPYSFRFGRDKRAHLACPPQSPFWALRCVGYSRGSWIGWTLLLLLSEASTYGCGWVAWTGNVCADCRWNWRDASWDPQPRPPLHCTFHRVQEWRRCSHLPPRMFPCACGMKDLKFTNIKINPKHSFIPLGCGTLLC